MLLFGNFEWAIFCLINMQGSIFHILGDVTCVLYCHHLLNCGRRLNVVIMTACCERSCNSLNLNNFGQPLFLHSTFSVRTKSSIRFDAQIVLTCCSHTKHFTLFCGWPLIFGIMQPKQNVCWQGINIIALITMLSHSGHSLAVLQHKYFPS